MSTRRLAPLLRPVLAALLGLGSFTSAGAASTPLATEVVPGLRLVTATPGGGGAWAWGQVATGFDATWRAGHGGSRFELGRAELGLAWLAAEPGPGLVVQLSVARADAAASPAGAGDGALVPALSRAYGLYRVELGDVGALTASLGLVPHPWYGAVEAAEDLRAMRPILVESLDLLPRDDLGAQLAWGVAGDRLGLRLAVMNGEGAQRVELDAGKDVDLVVHGVPWVFGWLGQRAQLVAALGLQLGTRAGADDDRYLASVAFAHPRLGIGVAGCFGHGYAGDGDREIQALSLWARGEPVAQHLGFYARLDVARLGDDDRTTLDVGAYTDLATRMAPLGRLRLFASYRAERSPAEDVDAVLLGVEVIAATAL